MKLPIPLGVHRVASCMICASHTIPHPVARLLREEIIYSYKARFFWSRSAISCQEDNEFICSSAYQMIWCSSESLKGIEVDYLTDFLFGVSAQLPYRITEWFVFKGT